MNIMKLIQALRNSIERLEAGLSDSRLFDHKGNRGKFREQIIDVFLRPFLPKCYGIGSGEVFAEDGSGSNEIDVVVYDDIFSNVLFRDKSIQLYPCELVFGSIEVKSQLTSDELAIAVNNVESVKRLPRASSDMLDLLPFGRISVGGGLSYDKAQRNPYLGVVFAYDGLIKTTVVDKLNGLLLKPGQNKALLPDFVVNYKRGYIVMKGKREGASIRPASLQEDVDVFFGVSTSEDTLPIFFLTINCCLNQLHLRAPDFNVYWMQLIGQCVQNNPQ
jgi:hypothetical protein